MVTTFYPPHNFGGDGLFVQQLSRDLVEAGHEVHVVHCTDAYRAVAGRDQVEEEAAERTSDGVFVHPLRSGLGSLSPILTQQTGRPVLKKRALLRILASGFDVINYHNISLIGGPGVLRMGHATKVFTLHEHWWVCPTHVLWKYTGELCTSPNCLRCCVAHRTPPQVWRLARSWLAGCMSKLDLIVSPSRFTAERHRVWMEQHAVRVPLEVLQSYSPPLASAGPLPADAPARFFLYAGRLVAAKGVLALVEVFARRPDLTLVLAGDGELRDQIQRRKLPNIHVLGHVQREHLGAWYAGAVALVFPSLCAEVFGLSAVEAMSCGTPVISRRCGGTEGIVDEQVGRLYDSDSELPGHLEQLWNDESLRAELGERSRERYLGRYTKQMYLKRYLDAVERARERFLKSDSARQNR
jgi:glycosyltransferase involved in cell wall biosynthesis